MKLGTILVTFDLKHLLLIIYNIPVGSRSKPYLVVYQLDTAFVF